MSAEELLRRLKEVKKKREKEHIEIKGIIKGIRLRKLNPVQDSIIGLLEIMIEGFKSVWDELLASLEQEIRFAQMLNNLETKIEELETNILQLRETLDEMVQAR